MQELNNHLIEIESIPFSTQRNIQMIYIDGHGYQHRIGYYYNSSDFVSNDMRSKAFTWYDNWDDVAHELDKIEVIDHGEASDELLDIIRELRNIGNDPGG